MPNIHYRAGTAFERKTRQWLADHGAAVVRAAGSKGTGKMDLVAFMPDGRILIIQCKATGDISPGEWNRLVEIAGWGPNQHDGSGWPIKIPLVAMWGDRAKPGQPWAPRLMRLADVKVPRSRTRPWVLYDAVHGRDLTIPGAPESGGTGA